MSGSPYLPVMRIEIGLSGPLLDELIWHIGDPDRGQVGVAAIGDDNIWSDVTSYVRSWSFRRGASRGDGVGPIRYDAGTCSIELNNGGREFDPTNLVGPYATAGETLLRPMVRVRITAEWGGEAYRLWYGYADSWTPDYNSTTWSTVSLIATDAFKIFNAIDRDPSAFTGLGEISSARINRILNGLSWPVGDRKITNGDSTVQATQLAGDPLSEMQLTADSELGELYMDADGNVTYRNRHALLEADRSANPQATFGDQSGGSLDLTYDFESGITGWTATGAGGLFSDTSVVHSGTKSMLTTAAGGGVSTLIYTRRADVDVIPGHRYRLSFWVYIDRGASDFSAAIDWADVVDYISTSYTSIDIPESAWTYVETEAVAPGNATLASFGPTLSDEDGVADGLMYVDDMEFADLDVEIPYTQAAVQNDDSTMANRVSVTIAGGTNAQLAEDLVSQQRYLVKSFERSDVILQTDDDALQYAKWLLYQSKDSELRFATITFGVPRPNISSIAWPAFLGRELGDRVTVIRRPPGGGDANYRDVFVRGIEMSSDGSNWTTQYQLQSATKYQFWTIGSPSLGRIGYNAIAW